MLFFSTKKKGKFFGFFNYKGSTNMTNFARFFFSFFLLGGVGGGEEFCEIFNITKLKK
jgi:hypothetical protein